MRFPLHVATDMIGWQLRNWWAGNKRVPVVLMLEPLHTCNLACIGCSPERYTGDLKDRLPLEKCFAAIEECGAPMVSICGGEPTIYPELVELIEGIIERRKHLLDRFYRKARPHKRLTINVHVDGMRETHDFVVDREGVWDKAVEGIKEGKRLGYYVCTNTTVFRETSVDEIEEMVAFLSALDVDGILLSPGYTTRSSPGRTTSSSATRSTRSSSASSSCRGAIRRSPRRRSSSSSPPGCATTPARRGATRRTRRRAGRVPAT